VSPDGDVYALCQDGEIVRLDAEGGFRGAAGFRRQAVWDVQPSPEDPRTLYCATDTGVAVVTVKDSTAGPMLRVEAEHATGLGFTRRVAPLRDGWLGITRDHRVFRSGRDGALRWSGELPALPHTIAASPDGTRALVATNAGAVELDTAGGRRLEVFGVDGLPVWAAIYLPDGDRLLITRNGVFVLLDGTDGRVLWRFDQGEYPKRLWFQDGRAYVTGDGGVKEVVVGQGVVCRWSKLLSNTVENAAVDDDLVCAGSYGMQLAGYDRGSGEFLGLLEDLPDYPKALSMVHDTAGTPYLLVGCRSGLLSLYRLDRRGRRLRFRKLRDHWLARRPAVFALRHRDHATAGRAAEEGEAACVR
jgi:outer membrane protein assembly factor BamB